MFLRVSEHEIKFLVIVVERTVGEAGSRIQIWLVSSNAIY
jgi:hypothetical protein